MSKAKRPADLISSGDMSASINGTGVITERFNMTSFQAVWSGTSPVGTIKIQFSNDNVASADDVTNWTDVSNSTQNVSGNTGSLGWNIWAHSYRFLRPVWTFTSGTGSLDVSCQSKGV